MPQFSRQAVVALHQTPIRNHAAANAGADGQEKHILVALPGAKLPLTQASQVGIIIEHNRHTKTRLELFSKRKVAPLFDVRRGNNHPGMWVERTR